MAPWNGPKKKEINASKINSPFGQCVERATKNSSTTYIRRAEGRPDGLNYKRTLCGAAFDRKEAVNVGLDV